MKFMNNVRKYGPLVALPVMASTAIPAWAQTSPVVTAAGAALDQAKEDAEGTGSLIVPIIATIVGLVLIFGLMRRAS